VLKIIDNGNITVFWVGDQSLTSGWW